MDQPNRRIVKSPKDSLRTILELQLDKLLTTAKLTQLDAAEIKLLESLLKIYQALPASETSTISGETTTTKSYSKQDIAKLVQILK